MRHKPFEPSWQDDSDMLAVLADLKDGTHVVFVLSDTSKEARANRPYPSVQHSCVEWRGRMFVIWPK